jgi:hypothetical protein
MGRMLENNLYNIVTTSKHWAFWKEDFIKKKTRIILKGFQQNLEEVHNVEGFLQASSEANRSYINHLPEGDTERRPLQFLIPYGI